jgi:hypothetical protein
MILIFQSHARCQIDDGSHVSADEIHLENLHTITLLLSGLLAITLCIIIVIQLYEKSTVHAAIFLVMAAAGTDSFSSMFELIHLSLYAHNGIGSYVMVSPAQKRVMDRLHVTCILHHFVRLRGIFDQNLFRMQFLLI